MDLELWKKLKKEGKMTFEELSKKKAKSLNVRLRIFLQVEPSNRVLLPSKQSSGTLG